MRRMLGCWAVNPRFERMRNAKLERNFMCYWAWMASSMKEFFVVEPFCGGAGEDNSSPPDYSFMASLKSSMFFLSEMDFVLSILVKMRARRISGLTNHWTNWWSIFCGWWESVSEL